MSDIKPLLIDVQLACLRSVRKQLIALEADHMNTVVGLCGFVMSWLKRNRYISTCSSSVSCFIPLFQKVNAICLFNAVDYIYWWRIFPYDYFNRIAFIDWIINELQIQKENACKIKE